MKRLLLLGAGHAHAQVLLDEITIDFAALCAQAGARWRAAEVQALDPSRRSLRLADGRSLDWDLLSLNIGSTLRAPASAHAQVLPLRPLSSLHCAWEAQLARYGAERDPRPVTVTAVGGGAAGVESVLAVLARLRRLQPARPVQGRLVSRGGSLLPGLAPGAVRQARRALDAAGVELRLSTAFDAAAAPPTDHSGLVLWATGAEAHDLLADPARRGDLAVSERGFVCIDHELRSVSHPDVFAVGDCAEWAQPLPKAGVFAVRMGPVLAHNLRAALGAGTAKVYQPQRSFLVLLDTSDGAAIASRGLFSAHGRWAARWKESIDRRFIARFAPTSSPPDCPPGGSRPVASTAASEAAPTPRDPA